MSEIPEGDFRRDPGGEAMERRPPEPGEGAAPADGDAPEHSRGEVLDRPQPSAPRREDLESEEAKTDDMDVESSLEDI